LGALPLPESLNAHQPKLDSAAIFERRRKAVEGSTSDNAAEEPKRTFSTPDEIYERRRKSLASPK
jgi:hypothetical protein